MDSVKLFEDALLTVNEYSRPGTKLKAVRGLVWHYVKNPATTARQNRDYFESLRYKQVYASAHYIIDLDGEIIRCIPDDEMAYHCGAHSYRDRAVEVFGTYPNNSTIGIEMCHPDVTGKPTYKTLQSLILLSAHLAIKYNLKPCIQIMRHYDVTGKICPKHMVDDIGQFGDALEAVLFKMDKLRGYV